MHGSSAHKIHKLIRFESYAPCLQLGILVISCSYTFSFIYINNLQFFHNEEKIANMFSNLNIHTVANY